MTFQMWNWELQTVDVGEYADLLYQAATFCGVCCVKAASRGGCGVAMENSRLFTSFLTPQVLNAPGLFWFSSQTWPSQILHASHVSWHGSPPSLFIQSMQPHHSKAVHVVHPGCDKVFCWSQTKEKLDLKSFPESGWQTSAPSALVSVTSFESIKIIFLMLKNCKNSTQKIYWPRSMNQFQISNYYDIKENHLTNTYLVVGIN